MATVRGTCMQLPIRIRLSISYFVIFSVAGVLLCCAAYFMAQHSLYIALDHDLDEHVDDVHDFFVAHKLANDLERARQESADEFGLKDDGKWLQIADEQGRWIYRAGRMLVDPHDMPAASQIPARGSFIEFRAGIKKVRALRRAFNVDGHAFVVETGSALTRTDQTLVLFRDSLLLILPAVFVMAGFAGHMMSRSALTPVAAIAREAQRIHNGNLEKLHLPELKTRDELAHLSATLNEMLERIESGVRSVRDFTAYASHELRTPVAMIRTEADLALQQPRSNNEYREAIEVIGSEAQRMSALLDSLLFLARADAGTEQVQLEPVDARRICWQAFEKFRRVFQRALITFTVHLPQGSVMVMADAPYLQRLLNIVLENAARYTTEGGRVDLVLEIDNVSARFEVSDTGIGIPMMDQPHIFDRFRRGANARDSHGNGSGLGLALAAWIAAHHRTNIEVESEIGVGSSFMWQLPLARSSGILAETATSQAELSPLASIRS